MKQKHEASKADSLIVIKVYLGDSVEEHFLTVVLLKHFCIQQLSDHIILDIHQEEDV